MPAGKNICNCLTPPGGHAVCEEHQLAVCRVTRGVSYTRCIDLPARDMARTALENWALSVITGVPRASTQHIDPGERLILSTSRYTDPASGDVITFSLPRTTTGSAPLYP